MPKESRTIKRKLTAEFRKAASSNTGRVHIVPGKDGWSVKREGSKRSTAVRSTIQGALKVANSVKSADRIIVHKKDGSIQRSIKKK